MNNVLESNNSDINITTNWIQDVKIVEELIDF